jgi:S1-C subfamily serine protease
LGGFSYLAWNKLLRAKNSIFLNLIVYFYGFWFYALVVVIFLAIYHYFLSKKREGEVHQVAGIPETEVQSLNDEEFDKKSYFANKKHMNGIYLAVTMVSACTAFCLGTVKPLSLYYNFMDFTRIISWSSSFFPDEGCSNKKCSTRNTKDNAKNKSLCRSCAVSKTEVLLKPMQYTIADLMINGKKHVRLFIESCHDEDGNFSTPKYFEELSVPYKKGVCKLLSVSYDNMVAHTPLVPKIFIVVDKTKDNLLYSVTERFEPPVYGGSSPSVASSVATDIPDNSEVLHEKDEDDSISSSSSPLSAEEDLILLSKKRRSLFDYKEKTRLPQGLGLFSEYAFGKLHKGIKLGYDYSSISNEHDQHGSDRRDPYCYRLPNTNGMNEQEYIKYELDHTDEEAKEEFESHCDVDDCYSISSIAAPVKLQSRCNQCGLRGTHQHSVTPKVNGGSHRYDHIDSDDDEYLSDDIDQDIHAINHGISDKWKFVKPKFYFRHVRRCGIFDKIMDFLGSRDARTIKIMYGVIFLIACSMVYLLFRTKRTKVESHALTPGSECPHWKSLGRCVYKNCTFTHPGVSNPLVNVEGKGNLGRHRTGYEKRVNRDEDEDKSHERDQTDRPASTKPRTYLVYDITAKTIGDYLNRFNACSMVKHINGIDKVVTIHHVDEFHELSQKGWVPMVTHDQWLQNKQRVKYALTCVPYMRPTLYKLVHKLPMTRQELSQIISSVDSKEIGPYERLEELIFPYAHTKEPNVGGRIIHDNNISDLLHMHQIDSAAVQRYISTPVSGAMSSSSGTFKAESNPTAYVVNSSIFDYADEVEFDEYGSINDSETLESKVKISSLHKQVEESNLAIAKIEQELINEAHVSELKKLDILNTAVAESKKTLHEAVHAKDKVVNNILKNVKPVHERVNPHNQIKPSDYSRFTKPDMNKIPPILRDMIPPLKLSNKYSVLMDGSPESVSLQSRLGLGDNIPDRHNNVGFITMPGNRESISGCLIAKNGIITAMHTFFGPGGFPIHPDPTKLVVRDINGNVINVAQLDMHHSVDLMRIVPEHTTFHPTDYKDFKIESPVPGEKCYVIVNRDGHLVTNTGKVGDVQLTEAHSNSRTQLCYQVTYDSIEGDSGSPVWNMRGNLIGIHRAGSTNTSRSPFNYMVGCNVAMSAFIKSNGTVANFFANSKN